MMAVPPNIDPLNYLVSVTGDCSNTASGIISVFVNGGTPPYSFNWQDFSPCYNSTGICQKFGLTGGVYAVRINDSSLPVNNEFIVNIPVSNGVCASILDVQNTSCNLLNGAVTGSSTSNYSSTTFLLVDSADTLLQSATTAQQYIVFNNLSAGTYNLIAVDLGGCSGRTQSFIIEDSTTLDFGFYVVPNSNCGTNAQLGKLYVTGVTGTAPYTYQWSVGGSSTSSLTGLTAGIYSCTVTDYYGCQASKSAEVTNVDPLGFGSWTPTNPTCFNNNGALTLQITGGTAPFYYSASTGYYEISYSNQFTLTGLSSGDYSVAVTDAGLCRINVTTNLSSPGSIASVNITSSNSLCSSSNGAISIYVSQGTVPYTYTLVKPDGDTETVVSNSPSQLFSSLGEGDYVVFVTDSTNCSYNQSVYIYAVDSFVISTEVTGTTCNSQNGYIQVTKSEGGQSPFDFYLDNTQQVIDTTLSAITFSNVSSGQHTVRVVDATGCTQTQQVYVGVTEPLSFSLYTKNCGTGDQGEITAFISSGVPPFTYNWSSNVQSNPQQITVTGLTAGTYSLTMVDANGCSQSNTVTISCSQQYVSYQTYTMGSETLQVQSGTKFGILQMLNDGYQDLIDGDTNCKLNLATYIAKVSTEPDGLNTQQVFATGATLNIAPADNLWYDAVKSLLLTIPGVSQVIVDPIENSFSITTDPNNTSLINQRIVIEMIILYDISC